MDAADRWLADHKRSKQYIRKGKKQKGLSKKMKLVKKAHRAGATIALADFWSNVHPSDAPTWAMNLCTDGKPRLGPAGRLDLLVRAAKYGSRHRRKKPRPVDSREGFNDANHLRFFFSKPCWVCGNKSDHRHHIFMLSMGGTNHVQNIVPLCEMCHAKVHPWLEVKNPDAVTLDTEYLSMFG